MRNEPMQDESIRNERKHGENAGNTGNAGNVGNAVNSDIARNTGFSRFTRSPLVLASIAGIVILAALALDQYTKMLAIEHLSGGRTYVAIPSLLGMRFVENDGAAWGMLGGQRILLLVAPIAGCCALLYYFFQTLKKNSVLLTFGIALIFAGGCGNLIDRIARGGRVVDFIEFLFINFPVFNIADICVTCGTIFIAVYLLFVEGRKHE